MKQTQFESSKAVSYVNYWPCLILMFVLLCTYFDLACKPHNIICISQTTYYFRWKSKRDLWPNGHKLHNGKDYIKLNLQFQIKCTSEKHDRPICFSLTITLSFRLCTTSLRNWNYKNYYQCFPTSSIHTQVRHYTYILLTFLVEQKVDESCDEFLP